MSVILSILCTDVFFDSKNNNMLDSSAKYILKYWPDKIRRNKLIEYVLHVLPTGNSMNRL